MSEQDVRLTREQQTWRWRVLIATYFGYGGYCVGSPAHCGNDGMMSYLVWPFAHTIGGRTQRAA